MVIDEAVTLTGSYNWTRGAAANSENLNLVSSPAVAVWPTRRTGTTASLAPSGSSGVKIGDGRGRKGNGDDDGPLRRIFWRLADALDYLLTLTCCAS